MSWRGGGGFVGIDNKTKTGLWAMNDVLVDRNYIRPPIWAKGTGGSVQDVDGWRIHTFTSTGVFQCTRYGKVEFLVVAGGGSGGGRYYGGGGGGGGYRSSISIDGEMSGGSSPVEDPVILKREGCIVVVGAGGPAVASESHTGLGNKGSNSSVGGIVSMGGGPGGGQNYYGPGTGTDGGCGGGARNTGGAGKGIGGQGCDGVGNRGGGAKLSGSTAANGMPTSVSGVSITYSTGGPGNSNIEAGQNTGGGGGGAMSGIAASGGSGIVIIRYPI